MSFRRKPDREGSQVPSSRYVASNDFYMFGVLERKLERTILDDCVFMEEIDDRMATVKRCESINVFHTWIEKVSRLIASTGYCLIN
jgi:hypothetical protein